MLSLFVPTKTIFRLLPIIRHIFFVVVSSIEKRNALKPFDFPLLRVPSEYRLIRHKACLSKWKKAGTVLKETTEVQMPRNSFLRVEGDSRGIKILCRSGSCWITQEGDWKDYLLESERDFTVHRDGLIVVQALTDTEIAVSSEKEKHSVCSPSTTVTQ
jgi:hypothetical protein